MKARLIHRPTLGPSRLAWVRKTIVVAVRVFPTFLGRPRAILVAIPVTLNAPLSALNS